MANEDMEGSYFGGGAIKHTIQDGEIYLHAEQVALILLASGDRLTTLSVINQDLMAAGGAHMLLHVGSKLEELRSELLNREIQKSFADDDYLLDLTWPEELN